MELEIRNIDQLMNVARNFPKATARGLNKTIVHVRTKMTKAVREKHNITAAELKQGMPPWQKATAKRLAGVFTVKGKPRPLVKSVSASMVARSLAQLGRKIKSRPTIKARIYKGGSVAYPHAFAARVTASDDVSQHTGIFWRTGKKMKSNPKRDAIRKITTASAAQMFSGVWSRLLTVVDVRKKLEENLIHEIKWEAGIIKTPPPPERE